MGPTVTNGYWEVEIGSGPDDPDLCRGKFSCLADATKASEKYTCDYAKFQFVKFTDVDRF